MSAALLLLAAAVAWAQERQVVVSVAIEAPPETGYRLTAGSSSLLGRTTVLEGLSPQDSITAATSGGPIPVSVDFYDTEGLLARCKPVSVPVKEAEAGCDPRFILPGPRGPGGTPDCVASCAPIDTKRRKKIAHGVIPLGPYLPPLEK